MDFDVQFSTHYLGPTASGDSSHFHDALQHDMRKLYPTRLSSDSIRLLTILPSRDADTPVECRLQSYHAYDSLEYKALSYVWGDSSQSMTVRCNRIDVQVTVNLHHAMCRVRNQTRPTTIWIDALCINQADIEEKNTHVPLMGQLYSQTTETLVYIGEIDTDEARQVLHALTALSHYAETVAKDESIDDNDLLGLFECLSRRVRDQPPQAACLNATSLTAVHWFFKSTWFERIWCVQEILLARESGAHTVFVYGDLRIPYRIVVKGMLALVAAYTSRAGIFAQWGDMPDMFCLVRTAVIDRNYNYLLHYLAIFKGYQATNPRDKVYGLLGVLHKKFGLDVSTFGVDYAKSIAEVYTDTAVRILRKGQDLELFYHISHGERYETSSGFPSWVPRWDIDTEDFIVERPDALAYLAATLPGRNKTLKIFSVAENKLLVYGLRYGSVTSISDIMAVEIDEEPATRHGGPYLSFFLRYWNEARKTRSTCLDDLDSLFASAIAFTVGIYDSHDNPDSPIVQSGKQLIADYLDYVHKIVGSCSSECAGVPPDQEYLVDDDGTKCRGSWERYTYKVNTRTWRRRMFVVGDGTMGTAPMIVREGDQIVGLYGACSPVALRSTEEGYIVLGPVYVRRYMDGDVFKEIQRDGTKPEQFILI